MMASYETDGDAGISQFLSALSAISDELTSSEVDKLKFVCGNHLTGTEKESVKSAHDLFTKLKEKDLISKDRWDFVIELLKRLRRKDLENRFKKAMQPKDQSTQGQFQPVPSYSTRPQEMPSLKPPSHFSLLAPPPGPTGVLPESSSLPSGHPARASSSSGNTVTQPQSNLVPIDNTCQPGFQSLTLMDSLAHTPPPPTTSPSQGSISSGNDQSGHSALSASSSLQCDPPIGKASLSGDPDAELSFSKGAQTKYRMDRNPRGLCVIINNMKFENPEEVREGSEVDAADLRHLFEKLHFKVEFHENLEAIEMQDELKRVSQLGHGAYDCFVCCILTHGEMGKVYGVDWESAPMHKITKHFKAAKCKSLAGKPKMFFIQACRGTKKQEGVSEFQADAPPQPPYGMGADVGTLPNEADFLLSFSTPPGYESYRKEDFGSLYINALVDLITKHHNSLDLGRILTRVRKRLSEYTVKTKTGKWKQISASYVTLRFDLYLPSLE